MIELKIRWRKENLSIKAINISKVFIDFFFHSFANYFLEKEILRKKNVTSFYFKFIKSIWILYHFFENYPKNKLPLIKHRQKK